MRNKKKVIEETACLQISKQAKNALKTHAAKNGTTIKAVVSSLINKFLEGQ